jgi:hypothetical protein
MKYLCLAYGDGGAWEALPEEQRAALLAQDDVLRGRGDLVAAVLPTPTTVREYEGAPPTADGPFAEASLPLAGFGVIEATDLDDAVRLVANTPCARAGGAVVLYPIHQMNDAVLRAT